MASEQLEVLAQHTNASPPLPNHLRPDLPQALSDNRGEMTGAQMVDAIASIDNLRPNVRHGREIQAEQPAHAAEPTSERPPDEYPAAGPSPLV